MRRHSSRLFTALALACGIACATPALACPDGQSKGAFGWCYPNIGGDVGAAWEHGKKEVIGQVVGNPLALWLQQSRDTSINGAQPIPMNIRQALRGYVPDAVMDRARFRVGDEGVINAAHVVHQFDGDVAAVTLIDVIVFRNAWDAYNDPGLWAHELTHVQQFMDWGVRDFAIRYARDNGGVEAPAYDRQRGFQGWRAQQGPVAPGYAAFPQPAPMPMPVGSPCAVMTYQGPVNGVAR